MKSDKPPGFTILIVDDSEELLEVLSIILEKNGHEVITKNSPADINNFVQANKIDLLLLDVVLGEANGKDVCKELKSNPLTNYFPILIMSGAYSHLDDLKECGADAYIEKPFDLHDLLEKINACLKKESAN
jgi:DNA-binding response OmpR family regulator